MIIESLKSVVLQNKNGTDQMFLRNLLKEALQFYVLNFVYTSVYGGKLLFKGGTCLRVCFDLPRLSEDLDFDIKDFNSFEIEKFINDLSKYFSEGLQYKNMRMKLAGNKRQLFLKFPVMEQLGLRKTRTESNDLFLRLDLSPIDSSNFSEEISIKASYDFTFLVKRYSLPDLFSSKIVAILKRSFIKGKTGLITFKGRDYFDLIWFLQRGVRPNFDRLRDILKINDEKEILKLLDKKVELLKEEYLKEDLLSLFRDKKFVEDVVNNFKSLYNQERLKLVLK